jgi:flagellar P-ring protein precursor FlgI
MVLRFLIRVGRGVAFFLLVLTVSVSAATTDSNQVLIRDIATIAGVRENPLVGYGIVIGLKGTGDRQQTIFTTQTLANVLQRLGVQIPASSVGDAKSIEGGVLLLTSLHGADGQVYAEAQGPITLGGYSAGGGANSKLVNHPNVGRVPEGGIVERDTSVDLSHLTTLSFMLREPDFTAAQQVESVINGEFGKQIASAKDSRRIDVNVAEAGAASVPILISKVQNLRINFRPAAKVVINELNGTIVMGGDVKLSAISLLHSEFTV